MNSIESRSREDLIKMSEEETNLQQFQQTQSSFQAGASTHKRDNNSSIGMGNSDMQSTVRSGSLLPRLLKSVVTRQTKANHDQHQATLPTYLVYPGTDDQPKRNYSSTSKTNLMKTLHLSKEYSNSSHQGLSALEVRHGSASLDDQLEQQSRRSNLSQLPQHQQIQNTRQTPLSRQQLASRSSQGHLLHNDKSEIILNKVSKMSNQINPNSHRQVAISKKANNAIRVQIGASGSHFGKSRHQTNAIATSSHCLYTSLGAQNTTIDVTSAMKKRVTNRGIFDSTMTYGYSGDGGANEDLLPAKSRNRCITNNSDSRKTLLEMQTSMSRKIMANQIGGGAKTAASNDDSCSSQKQLSVSHDTKLLQNAAAADSTYRSRNLNYPGVVALAGASTAMQSYKSQAYCANKPYTADSIEECDKQNEEACFRRGRKYQRPLVGQLQTDSMRGLEADGSVSGQVQGGVASTWFTPGKPSSRHFNQNFAYATHQDNKTTTRRKKELPLPLNSFRSRSGYQVTRVPPAKIKKAKETFMKHLVGSSILITKKDRNAIIDSMNDKSFKKSFIRSKAKNSELQSFQAYENCVKEQRMSNIEQKVTDMTQRFGQCADDLSQRSKDFNFYETLVDQVQRETVIQNKFSQSQKNEDAQKLKEGGNSETAYFNSVLSQHSKAQTDAFAKSQKHRLGNVTTNMLGSSTIKSSSTPFLSQQSNKGSPSNDTLTYAQFLKIRGESTQTSKQDGADRSTTDKDAENKDLMATPPKIISQKPSRILLNITPSQATQAKDASGSEEVYQTAQKHRQQQLPSSREGRRPVIDLKNLDGKNVDIGSSLWKEENDRKLQSEASPLLGHQRQDNKSSDNLVIKSRARSKTQKEEEKGTPSFNQKVLLLAHPRNSKHKDEQRWHRPHMVNQFSFNQSYFHLNKTVGEHSETSEHQRHRRSGYGGDRGRVDRKEEGIGGDDADNAVFNRESYKQWKLQMGLEQEDGKEEPELSDSMNSSLLVLKKKNLPDSSQSSSGGDKSKKNNVKVTDLDSSDDPRQEQAMAVDETGQEKKEKEKTKTNTVASLRSQVEYRRQKTKERLELASKRSEDRFSISRESSEGKSLKRWTTLTKISIKSHQEDQSRRKSEKKRALFTNKQKMMQEMIDTSFKLNERGRIKEILQKKYNLFQDRSSSQSRSKSKSSEQNQLEVSPVSPFPGLKSTLKSSSKHFFEQQREKSVSFNKMTSSADLKIVAFHHLQDTTSDQNDNFFQGKRKRANTDLEDPMLRYQITTSSPGRERSQNSIQAAEERKATSQNTLIKEEEPDSQSSGRQQKPSQTKSASPQDKKERVSLAGSQDSRHQFETALDCYLSIDTSKSKRLNNSAQNVPCSESQASDHNLSQLKNKLTERDQQMDELWASLKNGTLKKQPGLSELEMMVMFLAEIKREQGRKIELNLQDIIRSFRHKITSKDPNIQERFLKNRAKELNSILGSESQREQIDYSLVEEADGRSVKPTFSHEDMIRMVEYPELLDNDKFFQEFWKERSTSLNDKYLFQEKLHQFAIRKPYNDFNEKLFKQFKQEQIDKVLRRQAHESKTQQAQQQPMSMKKKLQTHLARKIANEQRLRLLRVRYPVMEAILSKFKNTDESQWRINPGGNGSAPTGDNDDGETNREWLNYSRQFTAQSSLEAD